VCNKHPLTNPAFPPFSAEAVHFCISNDQCGYFASYRRSAMETCLLLWINSSSSHWGLCRQSDSAVCEIVQLLLDWVSLFISGCYQLRHESSFLLLLLQEWSPSFTHSPSVTYTFRVLSVHHAICEGDVETEGSSGMRYLGSLNRYLDRTKPLRIIRFLAGQWRMIATHSQLLPINWRVCGMRCEPFLYYK